MRLHRYLKEDNIDLEFDPFREPDEFGRRRRFRDEPEEPDEDEEEGDEPSDRQLWDRKVTVLEALVKLLEPSGKISNVRKCTIDLRNREAKATTGLGSGIAIPHVRTPQARGFALGVAIAPPPGLWFDATDDEPVRLFFPMVAPAHDDRYYLKVERALAEAFADEDDTSFRDALLEAQSKGDVVKLLRERLDA